MSKSECKRVCIQSKCPYREELKVCLDQVQAKIDALMLEYCPEDMTQEQLDNWGKHQVQVDE